MVNTKTTLSKKVLALVLAVACMIAFTPAIAFTQSANATVTTISAHATDIVIDGSMTQQEVQNVLNGTAKDVTGTGQLNTVSQSGTTYTVTLGAKTDKVQKVTVAKGYKLVINAGQYDLSGLAACTVTMNGALEVNGTGNVSLGDVTIGADATALTIGSGATLTGDVTGATAPTTSLAVTVSGKLAGDLAVVGGTKTTVACTGDITGTATKDTVDLKTKISKVTVATTATEATATTGTELKATVTGADPATTNKVSYQWYRSTDNAASSDDTAIGTDSPYYTLTDSDLNGYVYVVVKESVLFGATTSNVLPVATTAAKPVATAGEPADAVLGLSATNVTTTLTAAFTNATNATYQWYANTTNSNTGGTKIDGNNMATYNVTGGYLTTALALSVPSTATKTYYYCVATTTGGSATSRAASVSFEDFGFTTQPISASVAVNATKNLTVKTSATVGTVSYKWYVATKADLSDAVTAGTDSATYGFTKATKGTYYVYCKATTGGKTIQSTTATMTVGDLAITTQPKDLEFTTTDTKTADLTMALNNEATTNITWYYNDTASTTGAAAADSVLGTATGNKFTVNPASTAFGTTAAKKTLYMYAVYNNNTPTVYTDDLTTSIVKISFVDSAIKTQPKDIMVAPGETTLAGLGAAFTMNGSNTALSTVSWSYSKNADMSDPTPWTNAGTTQTIDATAAAPVAGTYYYQATFTVGTKTFKTDVAKMTVAKMAFTTQPAATKTVAVGQDVALKAAVNSTDYAKDIVWYKSTTATVPTTEAELNLAIAAGTVTLEGVGTSFAPDTTAAGTYYYFAVTGPTGGAILSTLSTVTVTPKAKNAKFTVSGSGAKYRVSTATVTGGNVHIYGTKSTKYTKITVPATVKVGNYTYKVTGIDSSAFAKAKKLKTVTIKSLTLSKAGVKNSLKGSKVTTVKVPKSKYKTYKTYFTKKNCGKTVKVKKY